jgi:hypothetical protein
LLPYLSESVRANYNDIKNLQSHNERIQKTLDSMYEEFVKQEQRYKAEKSTASPPPHKQSSKGRPTRSPALRFGLIVSAITIVLLAAIGAAIFMWPAQDVTPNSPTPTPVSSPHSGQPLIPLKPATATHKSVQRLILEEFYHATNGDNWTRNDNWLTNAPLSEWYGVSLFLENVDKIVLPGNNLRGTLPDSFDQLNTITRLELQRNKIVGKLPTFDGWSSLMVLNLAENAFMDRLHSQILTSASALQYLNMRSNWLSSTLPSSIPLFTLQYLDLAHNQLSGSIPRLTYLPLAHLDLSNNYFDGSLTNLPTELRNLTIENNRFSGELQQLKNMNNLRRVRIGNNPFMGDLELLPDQLSQLEELNIVNTQLKSVIANGTLAPDAVCDASGVPFLCPLPDWMLEKCNAVCI